MGLWRGFVLSIFVLTMASTSVAELVGLDGQPLKKHSGLWTPSYSELSGFQAQWCAINEVPGPVKRACYGEVAFQAGIGARAIVFIGASGAERLFVESEFASVDLLNLDFSVVGPIGAVQSSPTIGQVSLVIDSDGEVMALTASVPGFGSIRAQR